MIKYVYVVHSKLNEDFVRDEFDTAEDAIAYAEENQDQGTSVEQVEVDVNDFGEVTDVGDSEIIWDIPEVEDALISDDEYADDSDMDELEDELDSDFSELTDEDMLLAAKYDPELDEIESHEVDPAELESPLDEAMKVKDNKLVIGDDEMFDEEEALKSAKPITNEKTIKNAIKDRIDSADKKMDIATKDMDPDKEVDTVCKAHKIILHSEDDVKDLKEAKDYHTRLDELEARLAAVTEEVCNDTKVITHSEDDVEDLKEELSSDRKAALKKALTQLQKPDVFAVVIGYNQGGNKTYLEKPLVKKSLEELSEFEKGFRRGKEGTKVVIDAVYPNQIDNIKAVLGITEELDYNKLREELEENEDEVECQICYDLVPKDEAIKTDGGYYICKHCMEENSKDESLTEDADEDIATIEVEPITDEEATLVIDTKEDEITTPDAVAVISALIEDEWEAITGYTDAIAKISKLDVENKDKIIEVLNHVSKEESMHVGQLSELLKLFDAEVEAKEDEGKEEAISELAGEDPHEEIEEDYEVDDTKVDDPDKPISKKGLDVIVTDDVKKLVHYWWYAVDDIKDSLAKFDSGNWGAVEADIAEANDKNLNSVPVEEQVLVGEYPLDFDLFSCILRISQNNNVINIELKDAEDFWWQIDRYRHGI